MIKKYKHMREDFSESDFTPEEQEIIDSQDDMPDGFFDDGLDIEDDDIWDDDTYVGDDDDIHLNNIADSDDDIPDDFFDVYDGFDEDDVIDVEDSEYWSNSKEIDPKDFDLEDNPDAGAKWIGLAASEDFDDDTFTSEEHSEAFHNAARKAMDPAHSDDFRRIISLEDMEESKRKVRKNRLKEDSAFFCSNKPKDENRDLPEWVYQKFGKIYESCRK